MKKIKQFKYRNLRNSEASEIYGNLSDIYEKITIAELKPAAQAFVQACEKLSERIRQDVASVRSKELASLDKLRDRTLTDLFRAAASGLKNPDKSAAAAALEIDKTLRLLGNPSRLPIAQQTNITRKIIRDLSSDAMLPFIVHLPVVKGAVEQLRKTNEAFTELFSQRTVELESRTIGITAQSRGEADEAAGAMVEKINAFITIYEPPALEPIVLSVNTVLDQARVVVNRRAAISRRRKNGAEAEGVEDGNE
jgi:hypothetical protein